MIGYIYSLSYDNSIFYIGSTINPESRLKSHRTKFGYNTIMEIVEEVEFTDRDELLLLERFWNDQFKQWGFCLKNKDQHKRTLSYDKGVIEGCKEDYSTRIKKGIVSVKMIIIKNGFCNDLRLELPVNEYNESKVKNTLRDYYKEMKQIK